MLSPSSFQSPAPPPPVAPSAAGSAILPGKTVASPQAKVDSKLNSTFNISPTTPDMSSNVVSDFMSALHSAAGKQDAEPGPKAKKQEPKDSSTSQNQNAVEPTQVQVQPADPKPLLLAQLGFSLPAQQVATAQTSSAQTGGS